MPEGFDVAARLAAGEPAVERIGTYVWACRQLGYQDPDLTVHPAQVRDWYVHDDGLDLGALDADCDALAAAAAAADDAVRRHGELAAKLAGAWSGGGAGAASEFLWRHGQSAAGVRDGLRRAADAMTTLRDELWRSVDEKVGAVLDIDGRRLPQRAEWLAAAQTVTAGAGDRVAASELVDQQIKPFVDNDVRSDWLAAMRRATASATAAYDAASARLDSGAVSTFDVPGELGPRWDGPDGSPASVAAVPAATVPAAAVISSPPPAFDPPAAAPAAAPAQAPLADPLPAAAAPAAPAAAPASSMPSLGEMAGGMPSLGTGASGFGQQLADLIGGLIGSSGDAPADPQGLDPPKETDGQGDNADQEAKTEPADAADESAPDEEADAPDAAAPDETETEAKPTPEPAATPVPPPPDPAPPVPPAVQEALPTEQTPCEIAADELPQVGE
ncbi:hypothetical protein [Mycobacterium sp. AZCC_0083]|uniref:hypothetical protein n=1 Tax=Mycobacterium sp. AZCC_0083 TaxID=2735882 RepID=UPI00161ACF27|nr:hypothetical protein [Mycobacterium sp. AZCC_0083]MBB5164506.1 hypothetical protein [Mycobacterium sp. AZCC_0083]